MTNETRRREETRRRLAKIGGILAVFLAIGGLIGGAIGGLEAEARKVEEMKQANAHKMAECWHKVEAGLIGGCDWQEIRRHIGGGDFVLIGVEVVEKPKQ